METTTDQTTRPGLERIRIQLVGVTNRAIRCEREITRTMETWENAPETIRDEHLHAVTDHIQAILLAAQGAASRIDAIMMARLEAAKVVSINKVQQT